MKAQRWLFIFAGICVLFLAAGCSRESTIDASVPVRQEIDAENDVDILNDEQSTVEVGEWQKAVGVWEDEYGRGYTMHVSVNESKTDILFSISFVPHGSVFLSWVLPCKLDGEILHYDKGVMSFMEILPDKNGEPISDSSVEKDLIGNFSFDSDQDILIWNDESNEYGDSTNFVRSQIPESELGEVEGNPANLADGGYDPYYGDGYSAPFEQENDFNTTLSNTELIRLNDPISVQLASEWKNAYNQSVSRDFRISNVHVRNIFPTIERREQLAAVITEVEFCFVKQGGSPAGSVYTVVIIDASCGNILSACITA